MVRVCELFTLVHVCVCVCVCVLCVCTECVTHVCVCVCVVVQEVEGVSGERDQLKALAEELGRELHQSKAQVGELRTETEYLNTQLEVCMKMYWLWVYTYYCVSILFVYSSYVHLENTRLYE